MKIAILSDSHDNLANLEKAIDYLNNKGIQQMIFCGDFCSPVPVKLHFARFTGQIDAVFGNTEDRMTITKLSLTEVKNLTIHGEMAELEIKGKRIAVTHYPRYAEGLASTGDYDLVCHGHTHQARQEQFKDTILLNPGEIMGFTEEPRFAIYDTETATVETIFVKDL